MHAALRLSIAATLMLALAGCSGTIDGKAKNDAGARDAAHAGDGATRTDAGQQGSGGNGGAGDAAVGGNDQDGGSAQGQAGSGGGADAGGTGAGKVSIFVAQGHKGRLMISCDDGKTWVADRTTDASVHCFDSAATDCDHDPQAARGLTHGNGYFLATFGWGTPLGHIARTKNGVDWEEFPQPNYADLAFGNGVFVANASTPVVSSDGKTWTAGGASPLTVGNPRTIEFAPKNGGRFVITGETGANHDVVISKDNSKTWVHPTTLPPECGAAVTGMAASPELVVIAQAGGRVCSSADGGTTWLTKSVASGFTSPPVWTGKEFMVWQSNTVYRSKDAQTWTMASITPSTVHIGVVAVNAKGTFVAVDGDWDAWYAKQAFYRSVDGVSWDVLPSTAFKGGHPIYFMEAGDVEASTTCPAP